jgi:hypothetical protein
LLGGLYFPYIPDIVSQIPLHSLLVRSHMLLFRSHTAISLDPCACISAQAARVPISETEAMLLSPLLAAHCQSQPSYRKQVSRRAEVQVNVNAPHYCGTIFPITPPVSSRINRDLDLNAPVGYPTSDACRYSVPFGITRDVVVESAGLLLVGKDSGASKMPIRVREEEAS